MSSSPPTSLTIESPPVPHRTIRSPDRDGVGYKQSRIPTVADALSRQLDKTDLRGVVEEVRGINIRDKMNEKRSPARGSIDLRARTGSMQQNGKPQDPVNEQLKRTWMYDPSPPKRGYLASYLERNQATVSQREKGNSGIHQFPQQYNYDIGNDSSSNYNNRPIPVSPFEDQSSDVFRDSGQNDSRRERQFSIGGRGDIKNTGNTPSYSFKSQPAGQMVAQQRQVVLSRRGLQIAAANNTNSSKGSKATESTLGQSTTNRMQSSGVGRASSATAYDTRGSRRRSVMFETKQAEPKRTNKDIGSNRAEAFAGEDWGPTLPGMDSHSDSSTVDSADDNYKKFEKLCSRKESERGAPPDSLPMSMINKTTSSAASRSHQQKEGHQQSGNVAILSGAMLTKRAPKQKAGTLVDSEKTREPKKETETHDSEGEKEKIKRATSERRSVRPSTAGTKQRRSGRVGDNVVGFQGNNIKDTMKKQPQKASADSITVFPGPKGLTLDPTKALGIETMEYDAETRRKYNRAQNADNSITHIDYLDALNQPIRSKSRERYYRRLNQLIKDSEAATQDVVGHENDLERTIENVVRKDLPSFLRFQEEVELSVGEGVVRPKIEYDKGLDNSPYALLNSTIARPTQRGGTGLMKPGFLNTTVAESIQGKSVKLGEGRVASVSKYLNVTVKGEIMDIDGCFPEATLKREISDKKIKASVGSVGLRDKRWKVNDDRKLQSGSPFHPQKLTKGNDLVPDFSETSSPAEKPVTGNKESTEPLPSVIPPKRSRSSSPSATDGRAKATKETTKEEKKGTVPTSTEKPAVPKQTSFQLISSTRESEHGDSWSSDVRKILEFVDKKDEEAQQLVTMPSSVRSEQSPHESSVLEIMNHSSSTSEESDNGVGRKSNITRTDNEAHSTSSNIVDEGRELSVSNHSLRGTLSNTHRLSRVEDELATDGKGVGTGSVTKTKGEHKGNSVSRTQGDTKAALVPPHPVTVSPRVNGERDSAGSNYSLPTESPPSLSASSSSSSMSSSEDSWDTQKTAAGGKADGGLSIPQSTTIGSSSSANSQIGLSKEAAELTVDRNLLSTSKIIHDNNSDNSSNSDSESSDAHNTQVMNVTKTDQGAARKVIRPVQMDITQSPAKITVNLDRVSTSFVSDTSSRPSRDSFQMRSSGVVIETDSKDPTQRRQSYRVSHDITNKSQSGGDSDSAGSSISYNSPNHRSEDFEEGEHPTGREVGECSPRAFVQVATHSSADGRTENTKKSPNKSSPETKKNLANARSVKELNVKPVASPADKDKDQDSSEREPFTITVQSPSIDHRGSFALNNSGGKPDKSALHLHSLTPSVGDESTNDGRSKSSRVGRSKSGKRGSSRIGRSPKRPELSDNDSDGNPLTPKEKFERQVTRAKDQLFEGVLLTKMSTKNKQIKRYFRLIMEGDAKNAKLYFVHKTRLGGIDKIEGTEECLVKGIKTLNSEGDSVTLLVKLKGRDLTLINVDKATSAAMVSVISSYASLKHKGKKRHKKEESSN